MNDYDLPDPDFDNPSPAPAGFRTPASNLPPPPPVSGYRTTIGERVKVITIDYWARPDKTSEWAEHQKKLLGAQAFEREHQRNWSRGEGDLFYPEWEYIPDGAKLIALDSPAPSLPVDRGWDFGTIHPACVWAQYSAASRRLFVLREFMPAKIDVFSFRDCVRYLSGEMQFTSMNSRSQEAIYEMEAKYPDYPPHPWFGPGAPLDGWRGMPTWADFGGHESQQHSALVGPEDPDRTSASVLMEAGIVLYSRRWDISDYCIIIRSLLKVLEDGYSALVLDPACTLLNRGLSGGVAMPAISKANPTGESAKPKKEGVFEHTHEALAYVAGNRVPIARPTSVAPEPQVWAGRSYSRQNPAKVAAEAGGEVAIRLYENRGESRHDSGYRRRG